MTVTSSFDLIRGAEFDASVAPPNDQAPSNEFDSDVTALSDGGFAVAYLSPSNGFNRPVFALNGTKSVFPFGDDDFIRNAEGTPVITALKRSDSLAIVWKEGATAATTRSIRRSTLRPSTHSSRRKSPSPPTPPCAIRR